jgi:hypothetical protein
MKLHFATLMMSLASLSASASFYEVTEKYCGDKKVEVQDGERVFIDLNKGMIGIGSTEGHCKVVDFQMVTVTELTRTANGVIGAASVVRPVGRRSSCSSSVSAYEGLEYSSVTVTEDSLVLSDVQGECSEITFKF